MEHLKRHLVLGLVLLALTACDGPQSMFGPDGPHARSVLPIWWAFFGLAIIVMVLVTGTALYGALHRRSDDQGEEPPLHQSPVAEVTESRLAEEGKETVTAVAGAREVLLDTEQRDCRSIRWILLGGAAFPAVTLGALFFATLSVLAFQNLDEEPDLVIEVVGRMWWWQVRYLDERGEVWFETANEIQIPVGRRIEVRLESTDVIHSFWVPQLAGKIDMIPGRTNRLRFQADAPGVYRGQCAEFCGLQHARMNFLVIAQPEVEFERWSTNQALPAAEPRTELQRAGREVFLGNACFACHAIRGTPAVGTLGPDLTHLASRRTLGAYLLPNTRGHLGGWIANPHVIKPGVKMPAVPLPAGEFRALLEYLMSLE